MLSHARMPDWPGSPVPPSAGPPTAKIGEPWAKEYIIVLHWIGKKKIVNPNNVQESDQGQTWLEDVLMLYMQVLYNIDFF